MNSNQQLELSNNRRLVGISNTYLKDGEWLAHARDGIEEVTAGVRQLVVIPYALEDMDWYTEKLSEAFRKLGVVAKITSPHQVQGDEAKLIANEADAIYIGGGNTLRLNANLHGLRHFDGSMVDKRPDAAKQSMMSAIQARVAEGMSLMGASAGWNVMGGDVRTTNDMHIAPQRQADGSLISRLDSIGAFPAKLSLNPHYIEKVIVTPEDRMAAIDINSNLGKLLDHQGESRDTRLKEALEMDHERIILALREGAYVVVNGRKMVLKGETGGLIFRHRIDNEEVKTDDDLSSLLQI